MDKAQYKNVYVFVEQREGVIQNVGLELLGKARELADALNEKVYAMLLGHDLTTQAQECIAYGADTVLRVDAPELATYVTEPYAQAIYQIIRDNKPSIVLIGATTIGRDLGPRLSARVETGLTADCTSLEITDDPSGIRWKLDGNHHLQGTPSPNVNRSSGRNAHGTT